MVSRTVARRALPAAGVAILVGTVLAGCEWENPQAAVSCTEWVFTADSAQTVVDNTGEGTQEVRWSAVDASGIVLYDDTNSYSHPNQTGLVDESYEYTTPPIQNPITVEVMSFAGGDLAEDTVWFTATGGCSELLPQVLVTPIDASPTDSTTPAFLIEFNEAVSGLAAEELDLGGSARPEGVTLAATSATEYTATVTGVAQNGTVTLAVPAGVATGDYENLNAASNVAEIVHEVERLPATGTGAASLAAIALALVGAGSLVVVAVRRSTAVRVQ